MKCISLIEFSFYYTCSHRDTTKQCHRSSFDDVENKNRGTIIGMKNWESSKAINCSSFIEETSRCVALSASNRNQITPHYFPPVLKDCHAFSSSVINFLSPCRIRFQARLYFSYTRTFLNLDLARFYMTHSPLIFQLGLYFIFQRNDRGSIFTLVQGTAIILFKKKSKNSISTL